jgi:hypothetical protein
MATRYRKRATRNVSKKSLLSLKKLLKSLKTLKSHTKRVIKLPKKLMTRSIRRRNNRQRGG